jgi:glycosyltransferase involved in cell wall biosynthesis
VIAALDATPLTLTSGGLARYVSELSLALAQGNSDDTYTLLSDQEFALPEGAPANLIRGTHDPAGKRWWLKEVRQSIATAGAQVFHGTNFEVPYLGNTPAILTIHDLSPWREPEWHSDADRVRERTPWLVRLRRARMILTVSEAMRREIRTHFGLAADRVRAIPLAAADFFRPIAVTSARERPYFLFLGTLEPRKNLTMLVDAWREIRIETGADLLIAGRERKDFVPVPQCEGLIFLGEVSDLDLPCLLSGALAFVYPSHYEGFGLPVLEAMQTGCPVIASSDAALTEVTGGIGNGAAIHVTSRQDLAEAMRGITANPEHRMQLRERGLERARHFSWAATARATRALYQEVVSGVSA